MATVSRFEPASTTFSEAHPIGTTVPAEEFLEWAEEYGGVLAPDLAILEPEKKVRTLRNHLNTGGVSLNLPQEKRFKLVVVDKARGTMRVEALTDITLSAAEVALDKGISGFMNPVTRSIRALEDTNT